MYVDDSAALSALRAHLQNMSVTRSCDTVCCVRSISAGPAAIILESASPSSGEHVVNVQAASGMPVHA
jgi:hypothetical protein